MIHSSAIDGHHFLITRRKGYDPAEVDAVVGRLIDTLRKYEAREAELAAEPPIPVADLEVVRARREEGTISIDELEAAARQRLEEAERNAASLISTSEEEADRIRELARADAARLVARRNTRAEELITSALTEVRALRARVLHETNEYRSGKKTEAAAMLRTAELQAAQIMEDARHEAGSILGRARREHTMLEQRIGQLRSAIAGIEGQFRTLAETTLEQTEVMSTMLSLETEPLEEIVDQGGEEAVESPEVVRLTQGGPTVDLTDSKVEAAERCSDGDERFVVAPGSTIYQRRGGGLRRRLEEEEVPELPE